jgi:hypothetical protein
MEKMDQTRTDCNLTHMGFAFNVCCDLGIGRSPASASQSTAESRGIAPRAQGSRRHDRGPVQCPYCIDAYSQSCLEKGSNDEEMTEAVHVACAIRRGAALVHGVQMRNVIEKLSRRPLRRASAGVSMGARHYL